MLSEAIPDPSHPVDHVGVGAVDAYRRKTFHREQIDQVVVVNCA